MNAATVVAAAVREADVWDLRRELSQLHILLLGAKADIADLSSPVPCRRAVVDVAKGLESAVACLDSIRARVDAAG